MEELPEGIIIVHGTTDHYIDFLRSNGLKVDLWVSHYSLFELAHKVVAKSHLIDHLKELYPYMSEGAKIVMTGDLFGDWTPHGEKALRRRIRQAGFKLRSLWSPNYQYKKEKRFDYVSNFLFRKIPHGMECEIFSFSTLKRAFIEAKDDVHREHVTTYIYENPTIFEIGECPIKKDFSDYRLTVDTPEDFVLIKTIIENLYKKNPHYSLGDIVSFLDENPSVKKINALVKQKTMV